MEKILYFDCFSGISGDMALGALIDLGADAETFQRELDKLHLDGYHLHIEKTQRQAVSGVSVDVHLHDRHEQEHEHDTHEHIHEHEHDHEHHHEHTRNLYDIKKIIEDSAVSARVKTLALSIFTEIARAEGKVHGKTLDQVHFHEVGAVDSIVDIVGTAICLDLLKIDRIYCSPIHEGHGFVQCQHGRLPIPVPAVTEMLVGSKLSLVTGKMEGELVTPTGFGILKATAESCGPMPPMKVSGVGYGFGKRETGSLNALRVFLGSPAQDAQETITVIETTMDDEKGEILGYTVERLMDGGALDAFYTPIFMKKNRPAVMLTVLCRNEDLSNMAHIIFSETSTIGLRHYRTQRMTLDRTEEWVTTPLGEVRVKASSLSDRGDGGQKKKPEYSDCIRLAKEHDIPLRKVYEIIAASNGVN